MLRPAPRPHTAARPLMPKLTVQDHGTFEVPEGKRLTLPLTEDAGTDQLPACGGVAKCTTCRVTFHDGLPDRMTAAEKAVREAKGLSDPNVRLSCQLLCDHDMTVEVTSRLEGSGRKDQGGALDPRIQPEPDWV